MTNPNMQRPHLHSGAQGHTHAAWLETWGAKWLCKVPKGETQVIKHLSWGASSTYKGDQWMKLLWGRRDRVGEPHKVRGRFGVQCNVRCNQRGAKNQSFVNSVRDPKLERTSRAPHSTPTSSACSGWAFGSEDSTRDCIPVTDRSYCVQSNYAQNTQRRALLRRSPQTYEQVCLDTHTHINAYKYTH